MRTARIKTRGIQPHARYPGNLSAKTLVLFYRHMGFVFTVPLVYGGNGFLLRRTRSSVEALVLLSVNLLRIHRAHGIGYGDFALKSSAGRAFFFLWSMVVVPTITMLIKTVVDAVGSTYVLGKIFSMSNLKHIFLRRGKKVAERDLEAGRSFLHARILQ